MNINTKKFLKWVSEQAKNGNFQAKNAYDFLLPVFEQADKRETIKRLQNKIESIKAIVKRNEELIEEAPFSKYNVYRKKRILDGNKAIPKFEDKLKKLQAEYDAEYGA